MLKCQKFSQPVGGYPPPRNRPPGTLPPCLNPLGVDTYATLQSPAGWPLQSESMRAASVRAANLEQCAHTAGIQTKHLSTF